MRSRPQSVDVTSVKELPGAAVFVKDVKGAAKRIGEGVAQKPKAKPAKKAPTRKR
jgi:hypothetical protein